LIADVCLPEGSRSVSSFWQLNNYDTFH